MLTKEEMAEAIRLLDEAEETVQATDQLGTRFPNLEIDDAYEIQRRRIEARVKAGSRVKGHKIGLTSKVMQRTVNISEPDYGHLLEGMFHVDGDTLDASRYIVPRIEVELAFVLGKRLQGPDVTLFDVLDATEYVQPALELIDGRSRYPRKIVDNIADNGAAAGVISGGRVVRPLDIDLRWVSAVLYKNGTIETSGVSAAVMGHPGMAVAWLANKLAAFGGALEAGHFILSGSFTSPVPVTNGDTIHVDYGPMGSISAYFGPASGAH